MPRFVSSSLASLSIVAIVIACSLVAAPAAAGDALFDFEGGVTFYEFSNPETTTELTHSDDAAGKGDHSLSYSYTVAGNPAYLGVGADLQFFDAARTQIQGAKAGGGLRVIARAADDVALSVQLRTAENVVFTASVEIDTKWARYSLPFSDFTSKDGTVFDPAKHPIVKIEIRPARKPATNTIWIDHIDLRDAIAKSKREGAK